MINAHHIYKGRGAPINPAGRFEKLVAAEDPDIDTTFADPDTDLPRLPTQLYKDTTRSILSFNDSPDVGFNVSINPYRGCEHGCIYCYARPTHEYLGLSAGLDFETRIFVKENAPDLLRAALEAKSWKPQPIAISGVTDAYQPIERQLQLTRKCLEVLAEFRNPVCIITKNHLVTRDIDVLQELARYQAVSVYISITTLDGRLARLMEPRASHPERRLMAVETLRKAGIPAGVLMSPMIPGLTDKEIPHVLEHAQKAGAMAAHYGMLRLPYGVKDLFAAWLAEHYPLQKEKVLNHIREIRGGKLNDPEFGKRMGGEGVYAESIESLFSLYRKRFKLDQQMPRLNAASFRRPSRQMELF